jgi:hypothetical protein
VQGLDRSIVLIGKSQKKKKTETASLAQGQRLSAPRRGRSIGTERRRSLTLARPGAISSDRLHSVLKKKEKKSSAPRPRTETVWGRARLPTHRRGARLAPGAARAGSSLAPLAAFARSPALATARRSSAPQRPARFPSFRSTRYSAEAVWPLAPDRPKFVGPISVSTKKRGRPLYLLYSTRRTQINKKKRETDNTLASPSFRPRHTFPTFLCRDSVYPIFVVVRCFRRRQFLPRHNFGQFLCHGVHIT